MKFYLLLLMFLAVAPKVFCSVQSHVSPVVLGIVDQRSKSDFESQLLPVLKAQLQECTACEIRNLTPYSQTGQFDASLVPQSLEASGNAIHVLLINWNEKINKESGQQIKEILTQLSLRGVLVVASAGMPKDGDSSAPLHRTILGQVPNAIIIGELGETDRLWGSSYYGPEMLTALRPPREQIGQGIASALFASKLSAKLNKKNTGEWIEYLKMKKKNTRKIWLDLDDLFGRL